MKRLFLLGIIVVFLVASAGIAMANPGGYNMNARIFVGTGMQYCQQKLGINDKTACEAAIGEDADDHLVMKWSYAWHMKIFGPDGIRGTGDEVPSWALAEALYGPIWCNNQWNGMFPGGSGKSYHSKILWTGVNCGPNYTPLPNGGQCIWGQFNIIHKQGIGPTGHWWTAHGIPSGYGY